MHVYNFNSFKFTAVFTCKSWSAALLFRIIFFGGIIRYGKGGVILTLFIMFLAILTAIFNSYMFNTGNNRLAVVCAPLNYMMWLSCMRYSMLIVANFVDFFGLSYAGGSFATIATFATIGGALYQFITISASCRFISGRPFFIGLHWYEREASDLCGCFFENSIDSRALLLPYCYGSHPLQKAQYLLKNSQARGAVFLSFIT